MSVPSATSGTGDAGQAGADAGALLEEIGAQAEQEKAEIEARLEEQLREIRRRTETEIRRLNEEADRQLERLVAREREALLGRMRLEEQQRRLAARRERVDEVFAQAGRRLEELRRSDGYPEALGRLIRQALAQAGAGAQLTVAAGEEQLARRVVDELKLECSLQGREAPPGTVLARSADGLRRLDNSLDGRLERARGALEEEVARLLWGTTTT